MSRFGGRFWRWLQSEVEAAQKRGGRKNRRRVRESFSAVAADVEALEPRTMLTFTYHGGALITNVAAQNVFLGSDWGTNSALKTLAGRLDSFTSTMVAGTQLDGLTLAGYNVYRGTSTAGAVGNFSLDKSYPASGFGNGLFSFDPITGNFSFGVGSNPVFTGGLADDPTMVGYPASIQGLIQTMINTGQLQAPTSNSLYCVYVEPGVIVSSADLSFLSGQPSNSVIDFLGYHGAFAGTTAGGTGVNIRYAVMPFPGFPNNGIPGFTSNNVGSTQVLANAFNSLTSTASHEIAEAVTDPDVTFANATGDFSLIGWYDEINNGEVADLSTQFQTIAQGYQLQLSEDQNNLLINPNAVTHTLGAATNIKYTPLTPTSGQLSWTGTPLAQGYNIYSIVGSTQTLIGTVGANATSFVATGLPAGTNVSFQVQVFNGPTSTSSSVVPGITSFAVASFSNHSGKSVYLVQTGPNSVIFVDGAGHMAKGTYVNSSQAYTSDYGGMYVTFNGTEVDWGDGSVWTSAANANPGVSVSQYANARGVPVYAIQNGTSNLAFVDGVGETSVGSYINTSQAVSSRYPGIVATFSALTVSWQDGSNWTSKKTLVQTSSSTVVNSNSTTQSPTFVGNSGQQVPYFRNYKLIKSLAELKKEFGWGF